MIRAIDICAGAGGWAEAAKGTDITITHAFDREADCLETYRMNHPGVETVQCDVTEHDFSHYEADLVLGGIPCEQISAARRGVELPATELSQFRRLIAACLAAPAACGAKLWCYEDVVDVLRYLPAHTQHFILDSQYFSAQRRLRAYIGNCPCPDVPESNDALLATCLRPGPHRINPRTLGRTPGRGNVYNSEQFYPWMPNEKSPTVIALSSRHDNYAATPHELGWRQLEWQELARLQGFPEHYLFVGTPSRVTKMVAQAVQIDTARAILLVAEARLQSLMSAEVSP